MDKNQSAVENFLKGTEQQAVSFEQPSKDSFEIVTEPEEEVVEKEKPVPFHQDPRVHKFINREIEKRLKDIKIPEPERQNDTKEDDDYYTRLIGNDTPEKVAMIREAKARDERMLEQAEERAFNRLSEREQEEFVAEKDAEDELTNAFESIEETYDVDISSNSPQARKTRLEFVSFVEKIAPKRDGVIVDYPDMDSAWETFSEMKKSSTQPSRAKELASRSMSRSAETTSTANQKRVDWNAVDEMMDGLK